MFNIEPQSLTLEDGLPALHVKGAYVFWDNVVALAINRLLRLINDDYFSSPHRPVRAVLGR